MQYALRKQVIGSSGFVSISEDEYVAVADAWRGLREILGVEEKFDVVLENYAETEETLIRRAVRDVVFHDIDGISFKMLRSLLSRRLINVLASARLYVDALPHHAGEILGGGAPEAKALNSACATAYDSSLAYRAMEALRNYAQHRDLVVSIISLDSRWEKSPTGDRMSQAVIAQIDTQRLANDSNFKPAVSKELVTMGNSINLMPLLREYVEKLGDVHAKFRETCAGIEANWDKILEDAINRYEGTFPAEGLSGLAAGKMVDQVQFLDPVPIFRDEYRKYLRRKIRTTKNLSKRYAKW